MANEPVTLTIDDKTVTVPKGTKVVDAAKTVGIEIPVFCYHEKLGPFGCCRMCLVEVEKMPKMATACTLDVGPGMVVRTNTEKVEKAQKGVLEFTLLNHPLDCPVCDKGGECPLQDNTFKFGAPETRMEFDRAHNLKAAPLSPVITLDRERCIACQRCTRYSDIIEDERALVMHNRGFKNEIGTFNNEPYATRFSGNVIDICPVGALTNTQFRFKARTWDLANSDTLCSHCGVNCNMTMGTRTNKLLRIQSRPNDQVDDGWICDKARWGYDFLESKNRMGMNKSRLGGDWKALTPKEAAVHVAEAFKKIADEHGPESVGFIGSAYGTNEELYLYQKLFRQGLGSNNIDHKTHPGSPGLPIAHHDLQDIETSDLVLLLASDPAEELPILELRLKKVAKRGGVKLAVLGDQSTSMDRYAEWSGRYNVGAAAAVCEALAAELAGSGAGADLAGRAGLDGEQIKTLADLIRGSQKVTLIYNPVPLSAAAHGQLSRLMTAMGQIGEISCGAIPAAPGTNAVGALDMGVLPDYYPGGMPLAGGAEAIQAAWGENAPTAPGLSAMQMIEQAEQGRLKALLIHRANPLADFPGGKRLAAALKKLDVLVVHDIMQTETSRLANVVLISNGPGYDEGTTTNIGGRVQLRKGGLKTANAPDWKLVSMMIRALDENAPEYAASFGVTAEIAEKVPGYSDISKKSIKKEGQTRTQPPVAQGAVESPSEQATAGGLRLRIAHRLFAQDAILDPSSQLSHQFQASTATLNEADASRLGIANGDPVVITAGGGEVRAQAEVSNRVNPGGVVVPRVSDEQDLMTLAAEDAAAVDVKKA